MNKTLRGLIEPTNGRYLDGLQNVLLAVREMNKFHQVYAPIVFDLKTIKDISNSIFTLAAQDINKSMKMGGWEGLIGGSDLNEELQNLQRNPAIILYTQLCIGMAVALTASAEQPELPQTPPPSSPEL